MKNLELVKSAMFGDVQADIYSNQNEMFMTINQLAECLGYTSRNSIEKILERNSYLKNKEFSVTDKMSGTDGKYYNTRIFTEDGIYEITMLAKTEKAKEFRAWVRALLKSLRKGETKIVGMTEYQRMMASTRAENARIRKAQILERLSNQYEGTYRQVLQAYATKELTGEYLLPLPELPQKTYSATELGKKLGVSANKIGILANQNHLKTDEYGSWFNDKSRSSSKEIQSFRYYENAIPVLQKLLSGNIVS